MKQVLTIFNRDKIFITEPTIEDSREWRNSAKIVAAENKYLLVESDTVHSVEKIKNKILTNLDSKEQLILVAKHNSKVVGILQANRKKLKKMRHVCEFGVWIIPKYRRCGISKHMIAMMEKWAKNIKLKKICLSVFQNNIPAISLYIKANYKFAGSYKKHIEIDKEFYDLILMEKDI